MRALSIVIFLTSLIFAGCSSDDNGGGRGGEANSNRVNWKNVPSSYNPDIETETFGIAGMKRVNINLFGFNGDVDLFYSDEIPADQMDLRIYTVFKDSASWGAIRENYNGDTVNIFSTGTYSCSIKIENSNITALKGGCYVRLEIIMPSGVEVEVSNVERLLTKKFFAMSTEEFLDKIDSASFDDEKFEIIDEFILSYQEVSGKPKLMTEQLKTVLEDLSPSDKQMKALRKLHPYVQDRDKLHEMIEDVFTSSWDQDDAKAISK